MGCINVPRKGLSQSALLYGHSVLTRLKLLAKKSPSQSENRCFVTGNKILRQLTNETSVLEKLCPSCKSKCPHEQCALFLELLQTASICW
uniref:Uncharacterized protein n=1 Tax=Crocodylus porosus TaxID=8502 RepID=A0A7M4FM66_CROPO